MATPPPPYIDPYKFISDEDDEHTSQRNDEASSNGNATPHSSLSSDGGEVLSTPLHQSTGLDMFHLLNNTTIVPNQRSSFDANDENRPDLPGLLTPILPTRPFTQYQKNIVSEMKRQIVKDEDEQYLHLLDGELKSMITGLIDAADENMNDTSFATNISIDKSLNATQRLTLFQALVTYLHNSAKLSERSINCITVHALAQMVVDDEHNLDRSDEVSPNVSLDIFEPDWHTTSHVVVEHQIPRWVVKGMKLYYLAVRPNFIVRKEEGQKKIVPEVKRRLTSESEVRTEPLFRNSLGSFEFRVKTVSDNLKAMLRSRLGEADKRLTRTVETVMPITRNPDYQLRSPKVNAQEVLKQLNEPERDEEKVRDMCKRRGDRQRYARNSVRAELFCAKFPDPGNDNEENIVGFYKNNKWTDTKGAQKTLEQVTNMRKNVAKRRAYSAEGTTGLKFPGNGTQNLSDDEQHKLKERCDKQNWVGICDANFKDFGRGVVSLQDIQKDDIIVDYHGHIVQKKSLDEYLEENPYARSEYCIEIKTKPKFIIDATSEICAHHSKNRCLGRLANHGEKMNANMEPVKLKLTACGESEFRVMLRAKRDIQPFEPLCWDYLDDDSNCTRSLLQREIMQSTSQISN